MVQNSWVNLTETNRGLFPVGTVLQYNCDPGYLPDGPSILTCTTSGRWSSEPPQCIRSGGEALKVTFFYQPDGHLILITSFSTLSSFNYPALEFLKLQIF